MNLGNDRALWLLFVVPVVLLPVYIWCFWQKAKALKILACSEMLKKINVSVSQKKQIFLSLMLELNQTKTKKLFKLSNQYQNQNNLKSKLLIHFQNRHKSLSLLLILSKIQKQYKKHILSQFKNLSQSKILILI